MITTKTKEGVTSLYWDDKKIEGLKLIGREATATITLISGVSANSVGGGAENCNQKEFNAYERAKAEIAKACVTGEPTPDLESILVDAGWGVYPK